MLNSLFVSFSYEERYCLYIRTDKKNYMYPTDKTMELELKLKTDKTVKIKYIKIIHKVIVSTISGDYKYIPYKKEFVLKEKFEIAEYYVRLTQSKISMKELNNKKVYFISNYLVGKIFNF